MKALVVNCTLEKSPETSNAEALASVVVEQLEKEGVASCGRSTWTSARG